MKITTNNLNTTFMKKLFFLGATMSMALCANAQSLDNPKLMPKESRISVIPKELSYDGTNRIVIPTGGSKNDDPTHYTIYSNDFEELKTIQNAGSTTEYKYMSIEQKEILSASFDSENYVVMGTEESGNGGKKARKAKSGEEPNSYVIAPYLTFESEPTKAQVMAALQALGYTPEEDLYDYDGYSYYVIAREDTMVSGVKFSYPTQMVRILSYDDVFYARLYKLYDVGIYVYSETSYYCDPSYYNYGNMQTTFAGWTDDEIKDYLNEYLSGNYARFYYDYENYRYVYLEEVITVATDPNNWKWFVCAQEKAGKFVLNRAGYVLHDGALYMSGYQGNATYSYGDQEVDVFADVRTSKSSPYGEYINYDIANASDNTIYLTQKLFNSDAQYEYITFTPIVKKFLVDSFANGYHDYYYGMDGERTELNFPGEGKIYHEQVLYSGLNVVSESGNSIVSVTFPANFVAIYDDYNVFVLEGKKYIAVNGYLNYKYSQYGYNEDNIDATLIYQIGSNGSTSLAPVSDPIRVSVRPTYLGQDEAVTISTDENFKRNGQVRVVDMQGRVMQNKQIPAGQQSTQMHNLPQGMNFIQVMDGNQTIHTQPVIVK